MQHSTVKIVLDQCRLMHSYIAIFNAVAMNSLCQLGLQLPIPAALLMLLLRDCV